jgi:hypothetical protein
MIVEFRRVWTPEDLGERACAWCAQPHQVETVVIVANGLADADSTLGVICQKCLAYLAEANPECFPTLERYQAALRRYPEPVWSSAEEAIRASVEDENTFEEAYHTSWLSPTRY